ncbi:site-specific DNA-methyltransferase [Gillisia limnaea]|uniref:site-specific DNA-methyltransferase (adenine-specific) n=1 Tax=Gillisia limnaea (strain DSM 15749 / LMG 21470 / R-8282) TaxID=865937 RepID=H2BTI9_GILLR|nr:site-specific DNA-methyltransferase [Gillisia limnaea]EHQ01575.1 DNA methylase N-4/N-6 domain protein [Gillisia limnaea DSM 15749]
MPTLNWIGKDKVVSHHQDVAFKVLEHKYGFTNKGEQNFETNSGNKIIHGDNLEALKSLLPEYEGRIDIIYIDPPYNTGQENWVYNDNVNHPKIKKWLGEIVGKDEEDFTRHDKWLCMMYPRLKIINKLLSDSGVIFMSIDDNEQVNLRFLCDEIFGKRNFISTFSWEKKKKGSHLDNYITTVKEYVHTYAKDKKNFKGLIGEIVSNKETYPCINPGNSISERLIPAGVRSNYKLKNHTLPKGSVISAGNMSLLLKSDLEIENCKLKNDVIIESEWRYGQEKIDEYAKTGALYFTRDLYLRQTVSKPRYKKLKNFLPRVDNDEILKLKDELIKLYENQGNISKIEKLKKKIDAINALGFLDFDINNLNSGGWGSNEDGDEELRNIFGKKIFDFPKPSKLISKLLASYRDKNAIILDSFAGSGTTAHSVIKLNEKDGGNRKFILVEMEDYAENITSERVKKVIKGYGESKKVNKFVDGITTSFDFYELGSPIFKEDENLNEDVGEDKIRNYIYYSETKQPLTRPQTKDGKYLLDNYQDTGYYFYYEKDSLTTLDNNSLGIILTLQEQYIIYADICLLDEAYMLNKNIIFKKIPRDIKRF